MSDSSQYRVVLRLLKYSPAQRERYLFRVHIQTLQSFAGLPYRLEVEHRQSGTIHRFVIRGLRLAADFAQLAASEAIYMEDFQFVHDGEVHVVIEHAGQLCTIPIHLHHGRWQIKSFDAPRFLVVESEP
ncbi:MAG: hypothetical protein N2663_08355 [Chlorobi bacterium]|nr:hypothetical protein [Chlorobiota bacterium]